MPITLVSSRLHQRSAGARAQFEQDAEDDDGYRHRMRMNLLAVAAVAVVMGAGIWIVDAMVDTQKAHGCYSSGQRFCSLI
jgi:hypothetical protein